MGVTANVSEQTILLAICCCLFPDVTYRIKSTSDTVDIQTGIANFYIRTEVAALCFISSSFIFALIP
jgi:hypothetical protein